MTPNEVNRCLRQLAKLANQRDAIDVRIRNAVGMLRAPTLDYDAEVSWTLIGGALGVTRQAAQQHFGGKG